MVRQALRPNPSKRQVSIGRSIPAPSGGWDAQSPISAMPITNALVLDNWVPRPGFVELRRGYVSQMTGFGSPVESMMAYRGGAGGTDKLFAASGGNIYDASTMNAPLPAPAYSGAANNRWNYINFANAAGEWIVALNGTDTPIGYNAGTWGALPTISGSSGPITLNPTTLFNVFSHKARLFYLQQNSLYVWNPAAGAVGGACTLLDLSSIFSKGGRLICGAQFSYQWGLTADDFAIFMTDQGQVALYQGTDPTSATTWSLLGVFDLGPPLGPKALTKFGGDLAVVTADGVVPLSQALKLDRSQMDQIALTSKIMNAFSAAVKAYSANYGWQGILYPGLSTDGTNPDASGGSLAIFNVPLTTLATSMQFVQNVLTGAWCRFVNLNAFCWEIANNNIYFGSTSGVYQWDQGSSDNGVPIIGDICGAFSNFDDGSRTKRFKSIRALLNTTDLVKPALEVDVDYIVTTPTAVPAVVGQGMSAAIRYDWTGASGVGYVGAPRMQVNLLGDQSVNTLGVGDGNNDLLAIDGSGDNLLTATNLPFDVPCQLYGFDLIYEAGGLMG